MKSQRKWGAILSYVQIILVNSVSLVYTPFAIRMLGQSQYGLFGTASSLTGYLSLLSLGIGGAYIRWNARYRAASDKEGEHRLNGMYFTMFSIISVVAFCIGLILLFCSNFIFGKTFTDSELSDLKYIILFNVINSTFTLFFTPILMNIQSYERYLVIRLSSILAGLITPVGNVILLLMGGKAVVLSLYCLVVSSCVFVVYFIYAIKVLKMKFIFKGFEKKVFKEIFIFSSFLFLNTLTDLLTDSTDNIILGAVSGTVAVAIYTVGHNFKNYFLQLSTAVSSVFSPQVNRIVAEKDDNKVLVELMTKVGRVQFYIVSLILIGYISVGRTFVNLWAGENYDSAWIIGVLLLSCAYIPLFQNVGLEIQKAKNKHKFRSVTYVIVAVCNVLMTIPFSMKWGGIGAALATFICCMCGNVIMMNIYYKKGVGLDMAYFWKNILKIVPSFIPTIIVCVLINIFVPKNNWLWLLVSVLMICVVYAVSVFFLGMNEYEKDLVTKPIKKVLKR